MCELIKDIIIGLFTGIIAGSIVNEWHKRKNKKEENKKAYLNDIQLYSHYISTIKLKLKLLIKNIEDNNMLAIIENRPLTYSFEKYLSDEGKNITSEINNLTEELKLKIFNKETINYNRIKSNLEKLQLELLKNVNKYYIGE